MRRKFILATILVLPLNFLANAQSRPRSKIMISQPVEKICPPNDWYNLKKTEAQQHNVNKLASDLSEINRNIRVTQAQINGLANDLFAVSDEATKVESELIRNLAEKLAKAIAAKRISDKSNSCIAEDLWMVLNIATFRSGSVSATARVGNRLHSLGIRGANLNALVDALNSITQTVGNKLENQTTKPNNSLQRSAN